MADMYYCVKCRTKRELNNMHEVTMKNGKPAMEGNCKVCGTRVFSIVKSSEAKAA